MGAEVLQPKWLAVAGLVVPLVLLYILKVRRTQKVVSSTWLWQEAQRDLMARHPFRRLRAQIPLLLQILGLLALAVAAAGPAIQGKEIAGEHVAIIIDTSASMTATVGPNGESGIDLAKKKAATLVQNLGASADAMIIGAGVEPTLLVPPERDRTRLLTAIDSIKALPVEGNLNAAIELTLNNFRQRTGLRRVLVVTDGHLARPRPPPSSIAEVAWHLVGKNFDNVAIVRTDVNVGEDTEGHKTVSAFVLVANYGRRDRDVFLTMRQRNASDVLDSRRIQAKAGETTPVVLAFRHTAGDLGTGLIFDASPHDQMPVDDVAYAVIPPERTLNVTFVGDGTSSWLERAVASDPGAKIQRMTPAEATTADLHEHLVFVQGACPDAISASDLVVVDPPAGNCFGITVGPSVEGGRVTSWSNADSRLRFTDLDEVTVRSIRPLAVDRPAGALVKMSDNAIVADASGPGRDVTVVGFDVGNSNWPLRASFVVFVRNLMERARLHRSTSASTRASVGTAATLLVPLLVKEATLEIEGTSTKLTVSASDGVVVVPATHALGFSTLSWEQPKAGSRLVAASLVSEAESAVASSVHDPEETPTAETKEARLETVSARSSLIWAVALLALLAMLGDVWYRSRRARGTS